ncbi:MAG TPA: hypothetical protein VH437_21460 [Terriglobales bacterium]|jgi:hypothetical protein
MQAVTGIFLSQDQAKKAVDRLRSSGLSNDAVTLLTPGKRSEQELKTVPVDTTEQPGMGKAIGAVIGGAAGLSSAAVAAIIPGVGLVTAVGLLGAAVLTAAGAGVGAAAGKSLENSMSHGLPEDEIFVYEDALRKGRSVVVALVEDESKAADCRKLLKEEGAEAVDAARNEWWIGLRSAEQEHYLKSGPGPRIPRNFDEAERYYRMGFEAALHARARCKEFDQVSQEMANRVEELEQQNPGVELAESFTRGYQRGREYYQHLCDQSKAA